MSIDSTLDSGITQETEGGLYEEIVPKPVEEAASTIEEQSLAANNLRVDRSVANSKDHEYDKLMEEVLPMSIDDTKRELEAKKAKTMEYANEVVTASEQPESEEADELSVDALIRGAAGGVLDAGQNLINTAGMFLDIADNKLGLDMIPDDHKVTAISNLLPRSNNMTENMTRSITSFLVPFSAAMKFARGASSVGNLAKSHVIGAAVDFIQDPTHGNLAQMVKPLLQDTMLQNPVVDYLASPSDSEAEQRFKNALEGLALGGMTELLFWGVKSLKGALTFKKATKEFDKTKSSPTLEIVAKKDLDEPPPISQIEEAKTELPPDLPPLPPEANKKIFEMDTASQARVLLREGKGFPGNKAININLTKIQTEEDARQVIKAVAENNKEAMAAYRAGIKRPLSVSKAEAANDIETLVDSLMYIEPGQTFTEAQASIAQDVLEISARSLSDMADRARRGQLDNLSMNDAIAAHVNLQTHLSGAKASWGRIGNLQRQGSGLLQGEARAKAVDMVLRAQGQESYAMMVDRLAEMSADQVKEFTLKSLTRSVADAAMETHINGLLTFKSAVLNAVMTPTMAVLHGAEMGIARQFAKYRGSDAFLGEVPAYFQGMFGSFSDMLRVARKARVAGNTVLDSAAQGAESFKRKMLLDRSTKLEEYNKPAIVKERFGITPVDGDTSKNSLKIYNKEFGPNKAIDLVGKVIDGYGKFTRMPTKLLLVSDDINKSVVYRGKVNSEAIRHAREFQMGRLRKGKPPLTPKQLDDKIKQYRAKPPVRLQNTARLTAQEASLTQPLGAASVAIESLIRSPDKLFNYPISRTVFPYLRTELNGIRHGVDRVPGLNYIFPEVRQALKAGGADADMVYAKWSMGGMIMGLGAIMAYSGSLIGSKPGGRASRAAWEQAGYQDESIKIGDTYLKINKLDPIGSMLVLAADSAQIFGALARQNTEEISELGSAISLAVGHAFTPEMLTETFGDILDAAEEGTTEAMTRLITRLPTTFIVPQSGNLRNITKMIDPIKRDMRSARPGFVGMFDEAINHFKSITPGLSTDLPEQLNIITGEPLPHITGLGPDLISPIATTRQKPGTVLKTLVDLGMASPLPVAVRGEMESPFALSKPSRTPTIGGVPIELTPEQYHTYSKLTTKQGDKRLEDVLRSFIQKDSFKEASQERKKVMLTQQIRKFRDKANQLMLQDPEIAAEVVRLKNVEQALLRGE